MDDELKTEEELEIDYQKSRHLWRDIIKKDSLSFHSLIRNSVIMLEQFLAENEIKPSFYGTNDELHTYIWDTILYELIPLTYDERYQDLVWSINEEQIGFINRQPYGGFVHYYYVFGESFDPATFDIKKLTKKEQKAVTHFNNILQDVVHEAAYQFLAGYLLAKGYNIGGHYSTGREVKEGLECSRFL